MSRKWVGMMSKALKLPIARCGCPYPIGSVARPNHAKYALFYWSYVVFATSREALEHYAKKLSYYEREDADIIYYGKADVVTI